MRVWEITGDGIDALALADRPSLAPGPRQLRVRVDAVALNYRDLSTVRAASARGLALPLVPCADAAGEVLEVGADVDELAPGDRVVSCFFQRWSDGPCTPDAMATALGGAVDGVLADEVTLEADGVVPAPPHLTPAEAATLTTAGVTAWNATAHIAAMKPGETLLLLGTGGVSIFALQFARLLGVRAIVTSKSDEKLARARELGAWATLNYASRPDWDRAVLDLTDGAGADATLEVGGAGTLARSIAATRVAGTIVLVGILTGGAIDPVAIMRKSLRLQGLYVGPRAVFLAMNRAVTAHALRPIVDRRFPFAEAQDAFRALESQEHLGKIVVER